MGFLRTIVKLAAVGFAANMVLKARRDGSADREAPLGSNSALPGTPVGSIGSPERFGSPSQDGSMVRPPASADFTRTPGAVDLTRDL